MLLTINVEYRTTERINDKTVYKKNINGVIHYRLDGEDESAYRPYADAVGAATVDRVARIQSESYQALSSEGWYRVAKMVGNDMEGLKGSPSNSVDLMIKRNYATNDNEYHHLRFVSVWGRQEIFSVTSRSNVQLFTKIRYTYDSKMAYLEVYYNSNTNNSCQFTLLNCNTMYSKWEAITPEKTSETVDGVTVAYTYNIPARATPIADDAVPIARGGTGATNVTPARARLGLGSIVRVPANGSKTITLPSTGVFMICISDNLRYGLVLAYTSNSKIHRVIVLPAGGSLSNWSYAMVENSLDLTLSESSGYDAEFHVTTLGFSYDYGRGQPFIGEV